MPRNCRSRSMYSISSRVKPEHSTCGTTGICVSFCTAAATAIVPGRRRMRVRCTKRPLSVSVYTYSERWVVMLMYFGSYSRRRRTVLSRLPMPVPLSGGRISKENAVPCVPEIISTIFINGYFTRHLPSSTFLPASRTQYIYVPLGIPASERLPLPFTEAVRTRRPSAAYTSRVRCALSAKA